MKKNAFTLTELLIAMTLVGVIAVLTVPSLMNDFYKKSYAAKIMSVHKELQEGIKNMMINERVTDITDSEIMTNGTNFRTKYMRGTDGISYGYATTIEPSSGDDATDCAKTSGTYKPFTFSLPDGSGVVFCPTPFAGSSAVGRFFVDVNGSDNKPNLYGRDVFSIEIMSDGTLGVDVNFNGNLPEITEANCKTDKTFQGLVCFALLRQNNGKVTY